MLQIKLLRITIFSKRVATKNEHFLTGREKAFWRPVQAYFPWFFFALPCPRPALKDYRTFFHQPICHREWLQSELSQQCTVICKYIKHDMEATQCMVLKSFQTEKVKGIESQRLFVLYFLLIIPWLLKNLLFRIWVLLLKLYPHQPPLVICTMVPGKFFFISLQDFCN